jgi:colicin import membrane protein
MFSKFSIAQSLVLHVVAFFLFAVSTTNPSRVIEPQKTLPQVVEAVAVDAAVVEREIQRLREIEDSERLEREAKIHDAENQQALLKRERIKEEQALRRAKEQKERIEKERILAEAKTKEARRRASEAETQRASIEEELKTSKQDVAEAQRRAATAAKKAEEAEKRRIKSEKELRATERRRAEEALEYALKAEEIAFKEKDEAQSEAEEIDYYIKKIAEKVRQSFTILPGQEGLVCTLRITLMASGDVDGIEVANSSGQPTFDRHAENAVRKAIPLPVPSEPRLFAKMRSISFVFDPQQ